MLNYSYRWYHALLIFLLAAVWVIMAVGLIDLFQWESFVLPGLLIHSGIIIVSVGCTIIILKPKNLSDSFVKLSFNKSSFGYYVVAVIFALVVWLGDFWLQQFFFLNDGKNDALELQKDTAQFGSISTIIAICFLAPFAEEILFRGILLPGLLEKLKPIGSVVFTSLLFAAIHFSLEDFGVLFIVAVGYAVLTLRSKSIKPALLAHMINNSLTVYYLYTL